MTDSNERDVMEEDSDDMHGAEPTYTCWKCGRTGKWDEAGFRWTSNHPIDRGIAMPVCDHCEPC